MDAISASWTATGHAASINSDGQYALTAASVTATAHASTLGMGWSMTGADWSALAQTAYFPLLPTTAGWVWQARSVTDKRLVLPWSVSVSIGGVDVSARLTGQLTVEAEESTSRLAKFTLKPTGALLAVGELTGQPVVIDFIDDPAGAAVTTRLFTGEVNEVDYAVASRLLSVSCFDNLQGFFRGLSEAQILSLIPGHYSEHVFGVREDGWVQATDVLSTVCGAFDLDRYGAGVYTPWHGGTVSVWLDQRYLVDGSVAVDIGREKDRVHQVNVTFEYRYTRQHQRSEQMGWNWGISFCDWLGYGLPSDADWQLPTRDMFDSAVNGTGWLLAGSGIEFTGLPPDGAYLCGTDYVNWLRSSDGANLVTGASWTWRKHWAQTVTETYQVTVGSGSNVVEERGGYETPFDDNSWESNPDATEKTAWAINAAGDRYEDVTDRTALQTALLTLLNQAYTTVMDSARQNFLSARTGILPSLERSDFVSMAYPGVASGHGKVVQYAHTLDFNAGSAVSLVKIATNSGGGGAVTGAFAAPETDHTVTPAGSPALLTYIGSDGNAPPFNEDWTGVVTNYDAQRNLPVSAEQIYPKQVRVRSGEIDASSRDEATGTTAAAVAVPTGTDTLTIGV